MNETQEQQVASAPAAVQETQEKKRAGMTRRDLCLGVGGAAVLLAMGSLKLVPAEAQVHPPGGQDYDRLISACVRCQRCVEACPNSAIAPSHLEDGILTVRTPVANFDVGWCDFCEEANGGVPKCVEACPTGALSLEEGASYENTIIGVAELNQDWCLAYNRANGCRFCYDACPYEAIELDDYKRPVVIEDACVGCGACQSVCVSQKEGSIATGSTSRAITVVPVDNE